LAVSARGEPPGTLGFVYATDRLAGDLGSILAFLRETTRVPHWVGTVGMGVVATGREYFDEPALAVMLARLPERAFRVFPTVERDLGSFKSAMGAWLDTAQPAFGVVHADPENARSPDLVAQLSEATASYLVGGLTSSRTAHAQIADKVTDGGVSGVLFSAEVGVATALSQGCSPIGKAHAVTGGERNVIFELDGEPALEVLMGEAGVSTVEALASAARNLHAALPIPGSDTGDYMVRNLVGIDPERGWVAIGDGVAPGDRVMFCRRDRASAKRDLDRMLDDLRPPPRAPPPRGGVYYSCLARGPNLFGPNSAELSAIRDGLGDFPLVGFFCNGEISHNRLYGYTGVIALFL
jgi:small ligand-binding sensory domain FIST